VKRTSERGKKKWALDERKRVSRNEPEEMEKRKEPYWAELVSGENRTGDKRIRKDEKKRKRKLFHPT